MPIKSAFIKPPEFFPGKYSQVVEAARDVLTAKDLEVFEYAVASYGFVNMGSRVTGAQWVSNIARGYDVTEPRNAEVVRVIKKAMLVEEFSNWKVVYQGTQGQQDARDIPLFIGSPADVDLYFSPLKKPNYRESFREVSLGQLDHDADFADAQRKRLEFDLNRIEPSARVWERSTGEPSKAGYLTFPAQFFGLQQENAVVQFQGDESHLLSRIARFAQLPPVGKQNTPEALAEDHEAQIALLALLSNHGGYSVWLRGVTSAESGHRQHVAEKVDGPTVPGFANPADIEHNADLFMRSADTAGWTPADSAVFLARPTAAVQSLQGNRPFESVIHQNFIGYRLTPELTAELYARVHRDQDRHVELYGPGA